MFSIMSSQRHAISLTRLQNKLALVLHPQFIKYPTTMICAKHRPCRIFFIAIRIKLTLRVRIFVVNIHKCRISQQFTPNRRASKAAPICFFIRFKLSRRDLIFMNNIRRFLRIKFTVFFKPINNFINTLIISDDFMLAHHRLMNHSII